MKVIDLLHPELIKIPVTASMKTEAIRELADLMAANGYLNNLEEYLTEVYKREALGSTGVGMSIAIPHGKSKAVKEACVAYGYSEQGIDFQASDGPAHLIFLIAVPENADNQHLQILAQLSRRLMHQEVREELGQAATAQEVLQALREREYE
jgi:fructose-specific phosphotransferase system IIA component